MFHVKQATVSRGIFVLYSDVSRETVKLGSIFGVLRETQKKQKGVFHVKRRSHSQTVGDAGSYIGRMFHVKRYIKGVMPHDRRAFHVKREKSGKPMLYVKHVIGESNPEHPRGTTQRLFFSRETDGQMRCGVSRETRTRPEMLCST